VGIFSDSGVVVAAGRQGVILDGFLVRFEDLGNDSLLMVWYGGSPRCRLRKQVIPARCCENYGVT
jgi:hypothetical protein